MHALHIVVKHASCFTTNCFYSWWVTKHLVSLINYINIFMWHDTDNVSTQLQFVKTAKVSSFKSSVFIIYEK